MELVLFKYIFQWKIKSPLINKIHFHFNIKTHAQTFIYSNL